ncbi:MAG TPA: molybdenum cofactor biosynthesis protein MoaE [Gemmatimonadaceae bacterium]|jgi:molybdopterin synthase catalytic subunit
MKRSAVVTCEIDPAALLAEIRSPDHGAISSFIGTVRELNDGRRVSAIEYSAYTAMAELELKRILDEAEQRFDLHSLIVEHRTGRLELGDVSVAVIVAHAHRAPALDCTRFVIEEIKKRLPIWKMEHYEDGTREWVDPTRAAEASRA